jgi:hypothetical protein
MGRTYDALTPELIEWIEAQHLFFVATAPRADEGRVNLSPKGDDAFRVLDPSTVAYLDLTGSGTETIAHLRENGRITFMFCAFDGKPRILRLFGAGEAHPVGTPEFESLEGRFPRRVGARSIITATIDRIQTSCGYGVPLMDFVDDRDDLVRWADRKEPHEIGEYWETKNAESIDGLPGLVGPSH